MRIRPRQGYLTENGTINVVGNEARLDVQLSSGIQLTGVVVTDAGVPVADAAERAMSASDSSFGKEARTDANGSFQIEGTAPGHYNLAAGRADTPTASCGDFDASAGAPARSDPGRSSVPPRPCSVGNDSEPCGRRNVVRGG